MSGQRTRAPATTAAAQGLPDDFARPDGIEAMCRLAQRWLNSTGANVFVYRVQRNSSTARLLNQRPTAALRAGVETVLPQDTLDRRAGDPMDAELLELTEDPRMAPARLTSHAH
jgi:hypothetical protein